MTEKKNTWLKENLVELLALIWSVGGIIFLYCAAAGYFKGTESLQTQVVQGIFGILILITSHYWRNGDKKPATTIQTQDNTSVTVGPNVAGNATPPEVIIDGQPPTDTNKCPEC